MKVPHPGMIAGSALLALVLAAVFGLASAGGQGGGASLPWGYLIATVQSAAWQAALSTVLSLVLGTSLALALTRRRRFTGRSILLAMLGAATVAPTLVIIFGIVAVYGRSGWLSGAGLAPTSIFGLHGVVLAHVIMNAPFVARIMLHGFAAVPGEQMRLAALLRFSPLDCFRHLDWPVIRREAPGAAAFVFLLCFTSFAVVMSLGGGPRNATLEVAIYEALRIEADFARGALIAGVQIGLCLGFVALIGLAGLRLPDVAGFGRSHPRPDTSSRLMAVLDIAALTIAMALIAPVLLSVLASVAHLAILLDREVARALTTSLFLAALAAIISVMLAVLLASAAEAMAQGRPNPARARLIELGVLALIGLPPFALVAGLFVLLRGTGALPTLGLVLVPLINALMALPFIYRLLTPPLRQSAQRHGRLAENLGLSGLARLHIVTWPLLKAPLLAALAFAAALSLGDMGVIALFGGTDLVTLPYLLSQRLGAYRLEDAGALAVLIVALGGGLAWAAGRLAAEPARPREAA